VEEKEKREERKGKERNGKEQKEKMRVKYDTPLSIPLANLLQTKAKLG